VTDVVHGALERTAVGSEPNGSSSVKAAIENLALDEHVAAREFHTRSGAQPLSRMDQRFPDFGIAIVPDTAQKQALDNPATRQATADQSRRENARIVEDEQVA
jgi:hypothetical protein